MDCAGEAGAGGPLQLLAAQAGALESLLACMQRGWMCLLVGAPGSGELACDGLRACTCAYCGFSW